MKKEYEDILKKKELDFENKYTELKKNMMEFLKNAQKNMFKNNKRNLELNTKLGILYKNDMPVTVNYYCPNPSAESAPIELQRLF